MKKTKLFSLCIIALLLSVIFTACSNDLSNTNDAVFEIPKEYSLSFSEEFDNGYDETVWTTKTNWPRKGGYWSDEQIFTQDGNLIIRTEYKEKETGSGYYSGELYWDTLRCTYGYYEIRCKVDDIRGVWSSFWLMSEHINNMEQKAQDGCEIDVFESAEPNIIQNALHYDAYKHSKKHKTKIDNIYDGFHTYAVDWKTDSLKFYYDGHLLWKITDPDLISGAPVFAELTSEVNGFIKDEKPDISRWLWLGCGRADDKDNEFPSDFVIDYVRIYDNGDLIWSEKSDV